VNRRGFRFAPAAPRPEEPAAEPKMTSEPQIMVEASKAKDRSAIGTIARRSSVFSKEEEEEVFAMFDEHLQSSDSGYEWFSARAGERVVGFVCYGPAPFAQGAYDLYWICTDPEWQGGGVGRSLFAAMEADIRKQKGRLLMIWTSGAEAYSPARKFYEHMGCECPVKIRDYYQPGEDMAVFVKYYSP
jgi:GNAT superfamily N-acetyltransferase